jgi:hypothetical protein
VARYRELTGVAEIKSVSVPFIDQSRQPIKIGEKSKGRKTVPEPLLEEGKYKSVAAKILMKILYAARVARFDLLRAVSNLACCVAKWDASCDRTPHRLVCYIESTLHLRQVTWIGDGVGSCSVLYADASLSKCLATARSTSGVFSCIRGPSTFGALMGLSKRQHCVSHSFPESEIVAANFAVRTIGLPALSIWEVAAAGAGEMKVNMWDDSEGALGIIASGNLLPCVVYREHTEFPSRGCKNSSVPKASHLRSSISSMRPRHISVPTSLRNHSRMWSSGRMRVRTPVSLIPRLRRCRKLLMMRRNHPRHVP